MFIRLNDNLNKLNLEQDLRPWLRTVAVNECFLDLRRRERRQRLVGLFGRTPEEIPARQELDVALVRDVIALDHALKELPAKQRMPLGLMYFEGETPDRRRPNDRKSRKGKPRSCTRARSSGCRSSNGRARHDAATRARRRSGSAATGRGPDAGRTRFAVDAHRRGAWSGEASFESGRDWRRRFCLARSRRARRFLDHGRPETQDPAIQAACRLDAEAPALELPDSCEAQSVRVGEDEWRLMPGSKVSRAKTGPVVESGASSSACIRGRAPIFK